MNKPIKYSVEIMTKGFSADTMKEAYMIAVKWVSTNIISKDELKDITVSFKKEMRTLPTIIVGLHMTLNEKELRDRHCEICRETHKTFFINENCNCSWCNVGAYQRRMEDMLRTKSEYCRGIIKRNLERLEEDHIYEDD